ncbi:15491_t:CDS:2, partial [Gigaspora margarita]
NWKENDASNLLRHLFNKKAEKLGWEVFWEIHPKTKSLDKHKLIATYPKAANYLNLELYSSKEKWDKAYTNKFFTAGISSTLHIEDHPSLCELAAILKLQLSNEAQYINHNEWYHANTSAQLKSASAKCFPEIDHILKEYLTEEIRHKIIQSLYYYTIKENEELPNDSYAEESYDRQQIHPFLFWKTSLKTKLSKHTKFNDIIASTLTILLFLLTIHIYAHACYLLILVWFAGIFDLSG